MENGASLLHISSYSSISCVGVSGMVGQLVYCTGERGKPAAEVVQLYGLPVIRISLSPDGFWAERRLRQAGRLFRQRGCRRVLVPDDFSRWDVLEYWGLRPVEPLPFLRAHAAEIAIAALWRQGLKPEKCAVALRAVRTEQELIRAADALCPVVRELCITAPQGGEVLCARLRREYGMAVCPDYRGVDAAVCFHPETTESGGVVLLKLFSPSVDLCGVSVTAGGIEQVGGTQYLPLLTALWESGRIGDSQLEFS